MIKIWVNLFKVLVFVAGITVLVFNAELYTLCKQQQKEIDTISDQQKVELLVNSNKYKYQQDQIEQINKDLEEQKQQIKNQNQALADQNDESKTFQSSLVDIKAEADAIKEDMKRWQKDDVGVLAQLEKGVDNIQEQIKSLHEIVSSLKIPDLNQKVDTLQSEVEKMTTPSVNDTSATPQPDKKNEN